LTLPAEPARMFLDPDLFYRYGIVQYRTSDPSKTTKHNTRLPPGRASILHCTTDSMAKIYALFNTTDPKPIMWEETSSSWGGCKKLLYNSFWQLSKGTYMTFYNNFELSRVSFMEQPQIRHCNVVLTEHEPCGVYRHRWGDAPIRWLTMAMLASPSQIAEPPPSKAYRHPCGSSIIIGRHSIHLCGNVC
jgi:hypothetical protein